MIDKLVVIRNSVIIKNQNYIFKKLMFLFYNFLFIFILFLNATFKFNYFIFVMILLIRFSLINILFMQDRYTIIGLDEGC